MEKEGIFVGLLLSLVISSFLVSATITDKEHVNLSYIDVDMSGLKISRINFTTTCSNESSYYEFPDEKWNCIDNVGLSSPMGENRLYFTNVIPFSNVYTIKYLINNTNHDPFAIYVRRSDPFGEDNIRVEFEQDKVRIRNNVNIMMSDIEVSYPGLLSATYFNITSTFDESTDMLDLIVNDVTVLSYYHCNDKLPVIQFISKYQYGGLVAYNEGLVLMNINADITNKPPSDFVPNVLALMVGVIFYTVDEVYLPLWANLLFIKTQLIGIFVSGLAILRG